MKCNTTRMRGKELRDFKQNLFGEIQKEIDQTLKDREMMAGCRAQWMLLIGEHRKHGRGKKYLSDMLLGVEEILPSLIEDREAEVMDEMLINDLERIGLNIRETHKEYFECAERVKAFGKQIDKEKERKEAEAKEKELLEKLKRKELVLGKEIANA